MFHKIAMIGFASQEPQLRYVENGSHVTDFSLATRQAVSKEQDAG